MQPALDELREQQLQQQTQYNKQQQQIEQLFQQQQLSAVQVHSSSHKHKITHITTWVIVPFSTASTISHYTSCPLTRYMSMRIALNESGAQLVTRFLRSVLQVCSQALCQASTDCSCARTVCLFMCTHTVHSIVCFLLTTEQPFHQRHT